MPWLLGHGSVYCLPCYLLHHTLMLCEIGWKRRGDVRWLSWVDQLPEVRTLGMARVNSLNWHDFRINEIVMVVLQGRLSSWLPRRARAPNVGLGNSFWIFINLSKSSRLRCHVDITRFPSLWLLLLTSAGKRRLLESLGSKRYTALLVHLLLNGELHYSFVFNWPVILFLPFYLPLILLLLVGWAGQFGSVVFF